MNKSYLLSPSFVRAGLVLLALSFCGSLCGQRDAPVPDPDPELERKALQVAEGFEINLFAADPLLAKPIQMNFDPAGRLWVACSEAYPQIKPGQKQNDKIIVLEDTQGTGKADKTTVFADGLLIPTGLEPGDGGVYVVDSTDLLHLSSSKPGGKADRRRVMLSGFGTEDTHHMVHTLRWGPDGMLYFNQSTYIHSHIETPHGPRRLGGGGVWQYRPETQELEVFARGWINPWGHHFDRWGQSFVTDGANGEGINYAIPGGAYAWAVGVSRVLQGLNAGHPKYCGAEIVSGRHLPDAWQGNILTNDFRGHRVCRFALTPDGSGYVAKQLGDLVRSNHPAFRPIDVKMGPDGAIYIADWYNPIIQHGEVDFRDPRRDQTHGRIWRITAKGRPLVERPKLVEAKTEDLLEALKAPEDWTRHQARRVLKERGRQVLPLLAAWVAKKDGHNPADEPALLEGLWVYQALDVVEPKLLATLLRAGDYRIRAAATRVLSAWHGRIAHPLDLLAAQVADENPQVRLEAVRALAQVPEARSVELALTVLDHPLDKFLDYALWRTCRDLQPHWLPALQQGRLALAGNPRRLVFALQAAGTRDVVRPLVELVRGGKVPAEGEEGVLTLIASQGNPQDLSLVLDRITGGKGSSAGLQVQLLAGLEQTARSRNVRPAGDLKRIVPLLGSDNEAVRAAALRLAGVWSLEAVRPQLVELARALGTSVGLRQAALDGLVALGGPASKQTFDELCREEKAAAGTRRLALIALTAVDPQEAAKLATPILALSPDGSGAAEVFDAFLQRKQGAKVLAAVLSDQKLPADVAKIGVRTIRSTGREAPELIDALTRAGSLTTGPRKLTPKEMAQTVADVLQRGDPARGEAVFRRKDMLCQKCHAIAGAGGQVGPDLGSIGASAQVDYLIESLLEPNKAIKENYHTLLITTSKGQQVSGIKLRQSQTELVLRTAEDREVVVVIKEIEEQSVGRSLMPDGLTDSLTRGEFVDLVRFLSELGKLGPYSVSKARLVRRWQTLEDTPAARKLLQDSGAEALLKDDPNVIWGSAYSSVSGTLPLAELPRLENGKEKGALGLVRCQVEVTTAGPVLLRLDSPRGVSLYVNRTPTALQETTTLNLPVGLHTLTFAIDLSQRRESLLCEVQDQPGSPARVRVVGGR